MILSLNNYHDIRVPYSKHSYSIRYLKYTSTCYWYRIQFEFPLISCMVFDLDNTSTCVYGLTQTSSELLVIIGLSMQGHLKEPYETMIVVIRLLSSI